MKKRRYGKHPTQKPLALLERIVQASTNPGDLVLDPFMGSGTTGVAALNLDRKFIGIEMEEKYCKIAEKRLKDAGGQHSLFGGAENGER